MSKIDGWEYSPSTTPPKSKPANHRYNIPDLMATMQAKSKLQLVEM